MTEPTLESRNEAARAVGYKDWDDAHRNSFISTRKSIRAHALTLDELHGRKEVSEAEAFYRELITVSGWRTLTDGHTLDVKDIAAIAMIEAKFAGLRAPKEPEWIEWQGGECPVADDTRVEVKFRFGNSNNRLNAGEWRWDWGGHDHDIIGYRVLP